jgi:hypothetical protein
MRHIVKLPPGLLVALALSLGAGTLVAETAGNPYLGIAGSNISRLQPPQRVVPGLPPPPLARIKAVGITTILGDKLALLKVYLPAIPPEPAKEISCILTIGQREGPVEVLEIDEMAGSVKVSNSGTVTVLTLEKGIPNPKYPSLPPEPPPLPTQAASRR